MKIPVSFQSAMHRAWRRKGLVSTLLWPVSWLVRLAIARKHQRFQKQPGLIQHSPLPVVVVGNIYVGGTGKTPVVIALANALRARGWSPGVISRGYGVDVGERARSGRGDLDAAQFGDEPALIARATGLPVAVHRSRPLAMKALRRHYPDVDLVISDDGLQHLALGRDIEIIVQDGRGTGNGRVLPAGPLREPASRLQYVDFVISNLAQNETAPEPVVTPARQVSMRLGPVSVTQLSSGTCLDWTVWLAQYGGVQVAAVAAIGQPERFFSMLQASGVQLAQRIALPDHDDYAQPPFAQLAAPVILITAKDAVKCRHINDERLWVVHVEPKFSDPQWLDHANDMLRIIARQKQALNSVH
ncbi:tetraacyldisaccharide 4'-kinase [Pollutimonas thiosulfatoxidans]